MNVWLKLCSVLVLIFGCSQSAIRPYQLTRPDSETVKANAADDDRATPTSEEADDASESGSMAEENPSDPSNSTPTSPAGNTPAMAPVPATGSVMLSLSIIPPVPAGPYRNRGHIRSVWITDATNKYIKTIHAFAGQRAVHLKRWQVFTNQTLDATTGATQVTPAAGIPITATWDLKDKAAAVMMTGNYKLWLEFSESNTPALDANKTPADPMQTIDNTAGYEFLVVPFTVSPTGSMQTNTSNAVFKDVAVKHVP